VVIGPKGVLGEPVALEPGDEEPIFLGIGDDGAPLFAVSRPDAEGLTGLRDLASRLSGEELGLYAYASALVNWRTAHRFCGRCGAPTEARQGGHVRTCANGHQHFPRTDPVVIMLVVDGDRALLGRQAAWPAGRFSALAGFVEPGERLEAAVAREVREEAGVAVGDVRYVASQPWPFPISLMLGFHADYAGGDAFPSDSELEAVRWFSREELAHATREDENWDIGETRPVDSVQVPGRLAIARLLIERWLADD